MPLDTSRLKTKIKAAYTATAAVTTDREAGLETFAQALAQAIVEEIKELKITYSSGLTAPNGPVSGVLNHTVQ